MDPDLFDGQFTAIEHQRRDGRASGLPDQFEYRGPFQHAVLEVNGQVELDVMDANPIERLPNGADSNWEASSTAVTFSRRIAWIRAGPATLRPTIANDDNPTIRAATVVTLVLLLGDDFASRR